MSNLCSPSSWLPPVMVQGSRAENNGTNVSPEQQSTQGDEPHKKYPYPGAGQTLPLDTSNELWALPPGWVVARQETDGRLYYHELATGRKSWVHPMASSNNQQDHQNDGLMWDAAPPGRRSSLLETPMNATRRPDSHQCCAFCSLLLCLPMGVCALIHSYKVDKAWKQGQYGDAVNHSRQAYSYAWWGCIVGVVILLIWWFRTHEFRFPDWKFD